MEHSYVEKYITFFRKNFFNLFIFWLPSVFTAVQAFPQLWQVRATL